jgi:hypothetical protein
MDAGPSATRKENACVTRLEQIMTNTTPPELAAPSDRDVLVRLVKQLRDHASFRHGHYDGFHVNDMLRMAEAHLIGMTFCRRCRGSGYYFKQSQERGTYQVDCENPKCEKGLVKYE